MAQWLKAASILVLQAAMLAVLGFRAVRLAAALLVAGLPVVAWTILPVLRASGVMPAGTSDAELPRSPNQEERALRIASETAPIMRQEGFNAESARRTAEIVQKISGVAAVAITDTEHVLAFIGAGCEHHRPGDNILTAATKRALASGQLQVVTDRAGFNCPRTDCACPLAAAVIVPLRLDTQVVGSLKLYETHNGALPPHLINLAVGLAQLLSAQIELAELNRQAQLVTRAELDALRAQINPHFFFNVLNTIAMYSRVNPEKTRRLLVRLADYFRQTLRTSGHFQTLRQELSHLRTYVYLEKNRFNDRLRIRISIDRELRDASVPVLVIQPLVENAIKHGVSPKIGPGTVWISAHKAPDGIALRVADDGVGMSAARLREILKPGTGSGSGVGLSNVYERLRRLYGDRLGWQIESEPDQGTTISILLPLQPLASFTTGRKGDVLGAESVDRG